MSIEPLPKELKEDLFRTNENLQEAQNRLIEHQKSVTNLFLGLSGGLLAFASNIVLNGVDSKYGTVMLFITIVAAAFSIAVGAYRIRLRSDQLKMKVTEGKELLHPFMTKFKALLAQQGEARRERRINQILDSDATQEEKASRISDVYLEMPDAYMIRSNADFDLFELKRGSKEGQIFD